MTITSRALAATLLSSAFLLAVQAANAQSTTQPPATATRPSTPDQTSLPNNSAPPASTTQTTGQASQDPTVKEMNEKERDKVDRQGK
jgi:hypothetical protein